MKRLIIAAVAAMAALAPSAQNRAEVYLQADLTSAYLWRGQRSAGFSLQPVAGVKWRGLHFYVWGNEQICPPSGEPVKHEIDYFLKYTPVKWFTVGLKNVYVNTRGRGFFSFGSIPHSANGLDAMVSFDLGVVNAEWSTTIAGYDGYDHAGRRAYGSYVTINAPFRTLRLDWNAQVGIVPYYCSRYSDDRSGGFHVNMCALKASHTFTFSRADISLTPYVQLMVNPSAAKGYFQAGARFAFTPAAR